MAEANKFMGFASGSSNLVSAYHGGELTEQIAWGTIPSHAPKDSKTSWAARIKCETAEDKTFMKLNAPMTYQAVERLMEESKKSAADRHPQLQMDGTFPHAELLALLMHEMKISTKHSDKSPEQRRIMALLAFDRKNFKTFGYIKKGIRWSKIRRKGSPKDLASVSALIFSNISRRRKRKRRCRK